MFIRLMPLFRLPISSGPEQRPKMRATAAGEAGAADDRGGDGVELEEQAGAPATAPLTRAVRAMPVMP